MLKILVMASTFPRWEGDISGPFVQALSTQMAADGHSVCVLAPHARGAATHERWGALEIHRFRYAPSSLETLAYGGGIPQNLRDRKWRWLLVLPFFVAQFIAMRKLAKRFHAEVIHAHWAVPQGLTAVSSRKLLGGPPVVITTHAADVLTLRGVKQRVLRFALRNASAVTAVTHWVSSVISGLTGSEPEVVPMGVDSAVFAPGSRRDTRSERRGPRLLFVGRLAKKKGLDVLFQAMPAIRQASPSASLDVVGDGPERAGLESLAERLGIADSVVFHGAVANHHLHEHYRSADVFVLPSVATSDGDAEGLPVVLLEAGACGLPVVASNIPGIDDLIINGHNGVLVTPGDPTELATAITRIASDSDASASLSMQLRAKIVQDFGWPSIAARVESLLEQAIERQGTARLGTHGTL